MDLSKLETMLREHDWFYMYSDDHRYYEKGRLEWAAIQREMAAAAAAGLEVEAKALYEKFKK